MFRSLLVIVGETASGKSALALKLAQEFSGEIICADSMTVRKGLDIGSAKPSATEQALVPHHMLDIIEPDEPFTAAQFKQLASQAIKDIQGRGKLPILVGGSGLYIDSVVYNFYFRQTGDQQLRNELNKLSLTELVERAEALGLDLTSIDSKNKRRVIRLIETNGQLSAKQSLPESTILIGLQPDRATLNQRITDRVNAMLAAGLELEVSQLAKTYGWDSEAMKGVGYSQWHDYFLSTKTLAETKQEIIRATSNLAKRQRTWFKRNNSIHWFSTPVNYAHVVDLITTNLDK